MRSEGEPMKYKMNEIYNMDCLEAMKEIPDNYFELAIVDPPYGIGENGDRNKTRGNWAKPKDYKSFAGGDIESPSVEYFNELRRVSKNQIIWGANHFISKIPFDSPSWVVWNKENGNNDFADCELAYTSFNTAVRKFSFRWSGMLQGDMKNKENRIHPTQKPVALYKWLLNNYAKEGDKILDTHLGSGSSIIACHDLGFEYMAFELDKDYYEKAVERIEKHKSQISIFDMGGGSL